MAESLGVGPDARGQLILRVGQADWNFGKKMGQSGGWYQGPKLRTFIQF